MDKTGLSITYIVQFSLMPMENAVRDEFLDSFL